MGEKAPLDCSSKDKAQRLELLMFEAVLFNMRALLGAIVMAFLSESSSFWWAD